MKNPAFHSGFTLLELLVSIALFVVLMGILWNIVTVFARSQTQGTRLAERSQLVRSLDQILEDDLRAAIQDPIHPSPDGVAGDDDVRRFGLSGSSHSLRIDVIEINPFAVPTARPARAARFGEVSGVPNAPELKTVFYEFRPEAGLSRREIDFETPDINARGPEGSDMLAPEVVECRFRYFDGSTWSDSWESLDRGGLPVAIEVTLHCVSLADARRLRTQASGTDIHAAIARLGLPSPLSVRFVAYLPTSPVRGFEEYQRPLPPVAENHELALPQVEIPRLELPEVVLPEVTLPQVQTPESPPEVQQPTPRRSQQSWLRGGS